MSDAIAEPHDRFVRCILGIPERAARVLNRLPTTPLPWGPIEDGALVQAPSSFVAARLSRRDADLVFALTGPGSSAPTGYVLIEHQSSHDETMLYRAVEYALHILARHGRVHGKKTPPPPIRIVVLYHARRPWTAPLHLGSPAAGFHCAIDLIDLARIRDDEIVRRLGIGLLSLFALLLKHGQTKHLAARLRAWNPHFAAAARGGKRTRDGLTACLCYSLEVSDVTVDHLLDLPFARESDEARHMIKTTGQKLREEGRAEGRTEGRADMLRLLLRRRFGAIPERVRVHIATATAEELERLFERALDVDNPDEILDP